MHLVQDAVMGVLTLLLLGVLISCSKFDQDLWDSQTGEIQIPTPTPAASATPTPTSPPTTGSPKSYEFVISQTPEVKRKSDILFVLDNSGSMADELNAVYDRVAQFTTSLKGQVDFTIRVTTTDDAKLGELMPTKSGATSLGSSESNIEQKIREMISAVPFPAYNGIEMGLKGALQGLKRFSPGPVTNVILFSDEEDESPGSFSQYLTAFQDYARTNNTMLSFHPVVLSPKSYCPLNAGESYGNRYLDMALAFSASKSKAHDLCSLNILFTDLATSVTQSSACFTLPAAVTAVSSVSIDGSAVASNAYTYNSVNKSLCFGAMVNVRAGNKVRVTY